VAMAAAEVAIVVVVVMVEKGSIKMIVFLVPRSKKSQLVRENLASIKVE
jgi:hypothetical protein